MKYIVYLTVNKINGKVYVGVHKTNKPDEFDGYLGCGCRINSYKHRKDTVFGRAVIKYKPENFSRHTLFCFDSEAEAYEMEEKIVTPAWVKSSKNYNVQVGGLYSKDNTRNERQVFCYDLKGHFLRSFKSITEASMNNNVDRKSITDCAEGKTFRGGDYIWSFDKQDKIQPNYSKRNETVIHQYDRYSGQYIRTFNSMIAAANSVKQTSTSNITNCAKGFRNEAHGFRWSYEKVDVLDARLAKHIPVLQYSLDGDFIGEYDSAKDAANALGRSIRGNITSCCTGKRKSAGGFIWKYKYDIDKIEI